MLDDVKDNTENIDVNHGNIADNANNLQDYFKDTMNFDAIKLINNARLEIPVGYLLGGALIVEINGYEGYACDTGRTVDQYTANLLCNTVSYGSYALNFYTQGERLKINILFASIYFKAPPEPENKPLTIGEMHCPVLARTLSECTSSGWGDFRNECEYGDVLWLQCISLG